MKAELRFRFCCLAFWLAGVGPAMAEPVTVEGVAPIVAGDLAHARENAIRDALAEAARKGGVRVDATTATERAVETANQTVIKSSARIGQHRIVSERRDADSYRVTLQAEILSAKDGSAASDCHGGHAKRLLIGGFPLLHPEELRPGELSGYARLTAPELARRFGPDSPVLLAQDGELVLHYPEADTALGAAPADAGGLALLRAAAARHRAQYVLLGRFRTFELSHGGWGRKLELEALIADGAGGTVLARRSFRRVAWGRAILPDSVPFGSSAFYDSGLGQAYGELLADLAQWARRTAGCQPFFARVTRVEGRTIELDAGSEQGLERGDTLSALRPATEGRGNAASLGEVEIKAAAAGSASAEPVSLHSTLPLRAGDLLYAR